MSQPSQRRAHFTTPCLSCNYFWLVYFFMEHVPPALGTEVSQRYAITTVLHVYISESFASRVPLFA